MYLILIVMLVKTSNGCLASVKLLNTAIYERCLRLLQASHLMTTCNVLNLNGPLLAVQEVASFNACKVRDSVLRSLIIGTYWKTGEEFCLLRNLLMRPYPKYWIEYSEKYPFLFNYEWPIYSQFTGNIYVGDAVFTDGYNKFLIVELKSTSSNALSSKTALSRTHKTARHKKKKKILDQVKFYTSIWHNSHPFAIQTEGVLVTDQKLLPITVL